MRILGWIAAILFAVLPCRSQTPLREQLKSGGIPADSFSKAELDEIVDGASANNDQHIYFVYVRTKGEELIGYPQIVRYDRSNNKLLRAEIKPNDTDFCCGSPLGIAFTRSHLVVSFHDTPSASTALVVNHQLQLVEILYGFDFHEIAPDVVAFIASMVHFAPQHQERLWLADLRSGRTEEIYPPKADAMREDFSDLHERHMPPQEECMQANDPCEPDVYDESIEFLSTDRQGFTIRVERDVEHPRVTKYEHVDALFQLAQYTYRFANATWRYCEKELPAARNARSANTIAEQVEHACIPNLPVIAGQSDEHESPEPVILRKGK